MVKDTHHFPRNMLVDVADLAEKKGLSSADVIRLAIKDFLKKEARKI